jgi:hypothetical protein
VSDALRDGDIMLVPRDPYSVDGHDLQYKTLSLQGCRCLHFWLRTSALKLFQFWQEDFLPWFYFPRPFKLFPTSWNEDLEKLTVSQLVNKFPTFYGTRRFTSAFKGERQLSMS